MKIKGILSLIIITLSVSFSYGQDQIRSNITKVLSAGYSYYPYVNQSSFKFVFGMRYSPYKKETNEKGQRVHVNNKGKVVKIQHEIQANLIDVSYMFSHEPNMPYGCFNITFLGAHYRIGKGRFRLCLDGEFLGVSTINEALGEKIEKPNGKLILTNSVSAGLGFYITSHISVKVSGGMLARTIKAYLYPYGCVTLSIDIPEKGDVYRYTTN